MDVAFKMVDGDEGQVGGEGKRFGVGDAHQKRSGEARAAGNGDRVEIGQRDAGLAEGGADDRDDGAQMLAAGQLGDHSAIAGVSGNLRSNHGTERVGAALDDGGRGLVAGGFDTQN